MIARAASPGLRPRYSGFGDGVLSSLRSFAKRSSSVRFGLVIISFLPRPSLASSFSPCPQSRTESVEHERTIVPPIGKAGPGEQRRKAGRPADAVERAAEGRGGVTLLGREDLGEVSQDVRVAPAELEWWQRVFLDSGQRGAEGEEPGGLAVLSLTRFGGRLGVVDSPLQSSCVRSWLPLCRGGAKESRLLAGWRGSAGWLGILTRPPVGAGFEADRRLAGNAETGSRPGT